MVLTIVVIEGLKKQDVEVVLGDRVVTWPREPEDLDGHVKILTTDKGKQFEADIVVSLHVLLIDVELNIL